MLHSSGGGNKELFLQLANLYVVAGLTPLAISLQKKITYTTNS